jgi:hypothetical protein
VGVQNRITLAGFAKQTAKESEATNPDYQVGINSGQVATLDIAEEDFPTTWTSRLLEGHDRISATPGASFETLAMPKSIGTLLMLALGSDTVTGSADPWTHEFTPNNTLPYGTFFGRKDAEYYKIGDARVNELELSWELTGALKVKVTVMGCTYTFLSSAYTPVASERPVDGVLKGAGGTFTVHGESLIVKSGSIKIAQGLEPVFGSDAVLPKDVFPGLTTVDVSLTVVPENLQEFRRIVTGTTAGTSVATVPLYSTAVASFGVPGDADKSLTFTANRMRSMIAFPDTNAQGGPVELAVEGSISSPTSGDAFSFELENDVEAAY